MFQVRTHLSALSDDNFVIETNNNGTLDNIKTTSVDKIGEVIKTAASFIVTLLTGVPSDVQAVAGVRALFDKEGADSTSAIF